MRLCLLVRVFLDCQCLRPYPTAHTNCVETAPHWHCTLACLTACTPRAPPAIARMLMQRKMWVRSGVRLQSGRLPQETAASRGEPCLLMSGIKGIFYIRSYHVVRAFMAWVSYACKVDSASTFTSCAQTLTLQQQTLPRVK